MMENVLDYDEWAIYINQTKMSGSQYWRDIFDKARQGMIPADRAIEVPEAWPSWSKGAVLFFTDETIETCREWPENEGYVGYVSKPIPQWSPKIGEAVFYRKNDGETGVGTAHKHFDLPERWYVTQLDGTAYVVWEKDMKPFRPEAIGLSWGEI